MHIAEQPIKVKASKLSVISRDDTSPLIEPMQEIKVQLRRPEHKHSEMDDIKEQIRPDDTPPIAKVWFKPPRYRLLQICPDDTLHIIEPIPLDGRPRHRISGLDVIKPIVFGGLLECIASLSIISSAAAGDATTINIVVLGLANVFGGLVLLFHRLMGLNSDPIGEQYEEQLGKPGHFLLHATIAVISYLVFGLMAPVVYGFSFRKSDDKNCKLITVAAASLVCIMILSVGKAYVGRSTPKHYIQTIIYYASVGVTVSGLVYVSGELISNALKKLSVFDSRYPVNMSVLEAGVLNAALSSY